MTNTHATLRALVERWTEEINDCAREVDISEHDGLPHALATSWLKAATRYRDDLEAVLAALPAECGQQDLMKRPPRHQPSRHRHGY